ncbi:MAG: hypothetical protein A2X36_01375 [Elusimicrobia bacterium GWA2_69_24]|nr:MAG: hypothetical protein A2X36_01375 [Elusimicrobia bacterium GWA2_69_24]HBL18856.1 DUF47 domain-containing protein [Elusimicrobiota bacterium]
MGFSLIPKEEKFFDLFEQQAGHVCDAAKAFKELTGAWSLESPVFERIRDIEHEADITTHEIIDRLNRTFVTPFDREDIHELASKMDDVVDIIHAITNRMRMYRIAACREELAALADILVQSGEAIRKAVPCLRNMEHTRRLLDYCIEINRLENAGDALLSAAITRLFDKPGDPIEVLKWERVFEVTEAAVDKCENVANTIEGILVKQG